MSARGASTPARKLVAGAVGMSAVATSFGGFAVAIAPTADAAVSPTAPAVTANQDVNNDWGQTAAQVQEEINLVVDADPTVVAVRTRYLHALSSYASLKHQQRVALIANQTARKTATKVDDARTIKIYNIVSGRVFNAAREVVASQLAMVKVVNAVTARVKGLHYVQAPYVALPTTPLGLTAVGSSGQVILTWSAVAGATGYQVYRDGVRLATTISPTFLDTGLDNGIPYGYTVLATNIAGWSALTTEVIGIPSVIAPRVPTGVVAAPGDAQVSITWTVTPSATSYQVYRDGLLVGTVATPSFVSTGLTNATTYLFTVVALNGTAASSPSAAVSAVPVATAPLAPTNLVATPGDAKVTLTWTASVGATKYDVLRAGVKIATVTMPTYLDSTVTNGSVYSYTVIAYKVNSLASPASGAASATPVAPPLPTPTGLAATPGDATVSLTWGSVSGATSYDVYRGGTLLVNVATPGYTDNAVVNNTAYSYTVIARSAASVSATTVAVSATPQPAATGAPTGLSASAGNATVSLSWTVVPGATGYQVYRNGVLLIGVAGNSYTDNAVTNGLTYTYSVTALNGTTESAHSATVSASPFVLTPAQPTGLTATPGDAQVSLSWSASANATGYDIYRGGAKIFSQTGTTYTNTGLTNGAAYSYYVIATGVAASSIASATVSSTPLAPAPVAPTNLVAAPGNAQVVLSWTAVLPATLYRVYRNGTLVGSPTATTYTDTGLTNATTYSYYVIAVNQTTPGPASVTVSATPVRPPVNGTFTGAITSIASGHGTIRVVIIVSNSVITKATGSLLTNDGTETVDINRTALPQYDTKAVAAQSITFTKVSGATLTYAAYKTSLQAALTAAGL